jgi:hypothetical protein
MGVAGRTRQAGLLTALAGLGLAGLTIAPAVASAAVASPRPARASPGFIAPPRVTPSGSGLRQVCPTPTHPGQMTCMALLPARSARSPRAAGTASLAPAAGPPSGAYGPPALQEAYRLRSTAMTAPAGGTDTVAVVDAYNDPHAASDLAVYRAKYGLPFCTASGGCMKVVSQTGGSSLPPADPTGSWELEESLDLDMVSATCPYCHILLVEAKSDSIANLAIAERYAAAHASAVSNSWGSGAEFVGENSFDSVFFQPGVAITASAGDNGYGTQFPAASPYVTAVGGTSLQGATATKSGRQTAWQGTGSGCSVLEPQPSWQQSEPGFPAACRNRTETDISAVADPDPGVAVYDSVNSSAARGWTSVGGTSVSAPIIAAAYALADISTGQPGTGLAPGTMPAAYPYASRLDYTDVTAGSNGTCPASRAYLCHAESGYDGPTGLGTPHGVAGLRAPGNLMSVLNPGPQVYRTGAAVRLQVRAQGVGTATASYSATGLPAGLKLSSAGLAGTLAGRPGVYPVTVTATRGHATGTVAFDIVVVARMTVSHPAAGRVRLGLPGLCLGTAGGRASSGTKVQIGKCSGRAALRWTFIPGGSPAGAGQLRARGQCLTIRSGTGNGAAATLRSCSASAAGQRWQYRAGDELYNPHSGRCLADPGGSRTAGRPVALWACSGAAAQSWQLPAAPVLAGIRGRCLADPGASARTGTQVQIAACAAGPAQQWVMKRTGAMTIKGRCLSAAEGSAAAGAAVQLAACRSSAAQRWDPGPHGQLVNENSGLCLSDPKDTRASGTGLVQGDCYGRPGQVWAVS